MQDQTSIEQITRLRRNYERFRAERFSVDRQHANLFTSLIQRNGWEENRDALAEVYASIKYRSSGNDLIIAHCRARGIPEKQGSISHFQHVDEVTRHAASLLQERYNRMWAGVRRTDGKLQEMAKYALRNRVCALNEHELFTLKLIMPEYSKARGWMRDQVDYWSAGPSVKLTFTASPELKELLSEHNGIYLKMHKLQDQVWSLSRGFDRLEITQNPDATYEVAAALPPCFARLKYVRRFIYLTEDTGYLPTHRPGRFVDKATRQAFAPLAEEIAQMQQQMQRLSDAFSRQVDKMDTYTELVSANQIPPYYDASDVVKERLKNLPPGYPFDKEEKQNAAQTCTFSRREFREYIMAADSEVINRFLGRDYRNFANGEDQVMSPEELDKAIEDTMEQMGDWALHRFMTQNQEPGMGEPGALVL